MVFCMAFCLDFVIPQRNAYLKIEPSKMPSRLSSIDRHLVYAFTGFYLI